jgi:hypothetical protein
MPCPKKPFIVRKRHESKPFLLTLNTTPAFPSVWNGTAKASRISRLKLFCSITESPKGARTVAENRLYSEQSADRLKTLYETRMKDDP